jgi:hypothetical protein
LTDQGVAGYVILNKMGWEFSTCGKRNTDFKVLVKGPVRNRPLDRSCYNWVCNIEVGWVGSSARVGEMNTEFIVLVKGRERKKLLSRSRRK